MAMATTMGSDRVAMHYMGLIQSILRLVADKAGDGKECTPVELTTSFLEVMTTLNVNATKCFVHMLQEYADGEGKAANKGQTLMLLRMMISEAVEAAMELAQEDEAHFE